MAGLVIPTPTLDTWDAGSFVSADFLNKNVRDVQKFLAYAPLTIVMRNASQSIADSAQATITWDTEIIDTDGMFTSPSTNLVARRPGVYAIQYQMNFNTSTAGGIRSGHITINGNWVASTNNAPADNPANQTCSALVALNTGDIITGMCFQNSGAALACGASANPYNAPRMAVRLLSAASLDVTYSGGAPVTSNPKPPPSKPPTGTTTSNFTKTYYATWSRTYDGDNTVTWDDSAYCFQGRYDNNRGNTRSLVGFNYGQIERDLKGATNIRVVFHFKVAHSYYNSGMTAIVGAHNYTSKPSTWNTNNVFENQKSRGSCAAGGNYSIDFGKNNWEGWAFQNGIITGMAFGPGPSTSLTYYGYSYGATQGGKPYLVISYTK